MGKRSWRIRRRRNQRRLSYPTLADRERFAREWLNLELARMHTANVFRGGGLLRGDENNRFLFGRQQSAREAWEAMYSPYALPSMRRLAEDVAERVAEQQAALPKEPDDVYTPRIRRSLAALDEFIAVWKPVKDAEIGHLLMKTIFS